MDTPSVVDDDDVSAPLDSEGASQLRGLMSRMRQREPVHVDPEEYQLLLRMQDRMEYLERSQRKFLERHDIVDIAKAEARQMLVDLGFDMTKQAETASRVTWLMGLKPGFKGAVYAVMGTILTAVVAAVVSWVQTGKH